MKGCVCISVAAGTALEFVARAEKAADIAAAVELRFDSLAPGELDAAVSGIERLAERSDVTLIGTYRSSENGQGGFRLIPVEERCRFWERRDIRACLDTVDVEFDIPEECLQSEGSPAFQRVIRSHHDFEGVPTQPEIADLLKLSRSIDAGSERVLKIAVTPGDITDTTSLWNMNSSETPVIPLGMGEFGLWTRILALSRGAPFTYAAQEHGAPTAPGQIGFSLLSELYRAEEITGSTEIYGIVGKSSVNSLSPFIHNPAFIETGRDAVYLPFPVIDAERFYSEMIRPDSREVDWNLRGLSVTHPHKETFSRLVDERIGSAETIGAVNTVLIKENTVLGFNTDADGFLKPLADRIEDLSSVTVGIVGTGGAAKAAGFALTQTGARVVYFSRDPQTTREERSAGDAEIRAVNGGSSPYRDIDVLVNATPVGSRGDLEDRCPVPRSAFEDLSLAYDMVYNPERTRFVSEAESAGIPTIGGLEMLIEQAVHQFEIWTGSKAPKAVMRRSAETRLAELENRSPQRNQ